MKNDILTREKYLKFLNSGIVYDWQDEDIVNENNIYLRKSIVEICNRQQEKFDGNLNKKGCCFNFSFYLFSKFNGYILTCKDDIGIHCAFVYLRDGKLFVCDPASAQIYGGEFFDIPLEKYKFKPELENQTYQIYIGMKKEDGRSFASYFVSKNILDNEKRMADKIVTQNLKNVDYNLLIENLTTSKLQ